MNQNLGDTSRFHEDLDRRSRMTRVILFAVVVKSGSGCYSIQQKSFFIAKSGVSTVELTYAMRLGNRA